MVLCLKVECVVSKIWVILFSLGYRHHGLHLNVPRVTKLQSFRQGGRVKSIFHQRWLLPVASFEASGRDPRGTACAARSFNVVPKPGTTSTRGQADGLPSLSILRYNNRIYIPKTIEAHRRPQTGKKAMYFSSNRYQVCMYVLFTS